MKKTLIFAHRGLRKKFPENTSIAIQAALQVPGLNGVEFDVCLSKDEIPVIIHQESFLPAEGPAGQLRLLPSPLKDTNSWVQGMSFAEIKKIDAGTWFSHKLKSIRIPTLPEVLQLEWGKHTALVELKDPYHWVSRNPDYEASLVARVAPLLLDAKAKGMSIFCSSFNPEVLRLLSQKAPSLPSLLLRWESQNNFLPSEAVALAQEVQAEAIGVVDYEILKSTEWREKTRSASLSLYSFPLTPSGVMHKQNDNSSLKQESETWPQLRSQQIDGIISDFPEEALR